MVGQKPYHEYDVWQEAHRLTLEVYEITKTFPTSEIYGITSQLRRGSSSVAANIVEGLGRGGASELMRFLRIAKASARETHYFLLLSKDLDYLPSESAKQLMSNYEGLSIGIYRFIESIKAKSEPTKPTRERSDRAN